MALTSGAFLGYLPTLFELVGNDVISYVGQAPDRVIQQFPPNWDWLIALRAVIAALVFAGMVAVWLICLDKDPVVSHFQWNRNNLPARKIAGNIIRAFFVPSMAEELFWRAAVCPTPEELKQNPLLFGWVLVAHMGFCCSHIWPTPNILDKMPGRSRAPGAFKVFRSAAFMVLTCTLSVLTALLYYAEGQIWGAVLLHWTVVAVWQECLGGRELLQPDLAHGEELNGKCCADSEDFDTTDSD